MSPSRDGRILAVPFGDQLLLADLAHGVPEILHVGAQGAGDSIADLASLGLHALPKAGLDQPVPALVCPEHGSGWMGRPGLIGQHADGSGWAPRFSAGEVTIEEDRASVTAVDEVAGLTLTTEFLVRPQSIRIRLHLRNDGDSDYEVDDLTMLVPMPARADEILHLSGRWAHEFQVDRFPWPPGAVAFDNRRGRTSHDRVPAIFVGRNGFGENHGDVWGFALGWSGCATVFAERLTDGRRVVQIGELLAPGDVTLAPGDTYSTPWLEVAASQRGLNGVSQAFHESIRARAAAPGTDRRRPVMLNTWEAVYFRHDIDQLKRLAGVAADVGVELFVLDDGWFNGRRNDDAGLGDWWVDETVWPDGLDPLIDHVRRLGMEFGIWIEPEMVNRNSDLYRSHPDWVLSAPGYDPVEGRRQLVLDLGRTEVAEYLVDKLDRLLSDHEISFVKWDMNRDLVQASTGPRASGHDNMLGVYSLFDRIRSLHPDVEFESCASGGGRADFEILERSERIWVSDSNDALERQSIQRGFSILFPPEIMGAHIGPPVSKTSGRRHSLGFRAATAFFGHLGIEWDLLGASDDDRAELADIIAAHKAHRALLHGGTVFRLDSDDPDVMASMVVSDDRSEALLSIAQLAVSTGAVPRPLRLAGLDPDRRYNVVVLPCFGPVAGPAASQPAWIDSKLTASGGALMEVGLQPPLLHPETAVVVHIVAT